MDEKRIMEAAANIRNSRAIVEHVEGSVQAVQDHMSLVKESMRMALDEASKQNKEDAVRQDTLDLQRELSMQMAEILSFMRELINQPPPEPPIVNVTSPEVQVTLKQQPVNVDVPKATITVKPTISVPEPKVVIQQAESKMPKRLTIKHSDGSMSTIEFGK